MSRETEISIGQPIEPLAHAAQRQETQALTAIMADITSSTAWKSDGALSAHMHNGAVTTRAGKDGFAQSSGAEARCGLPNLDFDGLEDFDKPIYSQRDLEAALRKLKLSMLHKKPGGTDSYGEENFAINGFRSKPHWKPEFDNHNYDPRFDSFRKPQFQEQQQRQDEQTLRPYHNPVPSLGRSYPRNGMASESSETRVPTLGGNIEPRRSRQGGAGTADEWDSEATLRRTRQLMGLDRRSI
jgi:hypothetical protein